MTLKCKIELFETLDLTHESMNRLNDSNNHRMNYDISIIRHFSFKPMIDHMVN